MITKTMTSSARRVGRQLSPAVKYVQHECFPPTPRRYFATVGVSNTIRSPFETDRTRKLATRKKSSSDDSSSSSYFERKVSNKQERTEAYKQKVERAVRIVSRRCNSPRDVKKEAFRSWWDGRRIREEQMNRKARQVGMDWTIKVATIVERLPVVMPDKEFFEIEFEDQQAYMKARSGKEFPKEFIGTSGGGGGEAYTDEELMALLPDRFQPASRATKADKDGSINTLERRLKDRVYLMTYDCFPTTDVKVLKNEENKFGIDSETLLEAALRGLQEHIHRVGIKNNDKIPIGFYCLSEAPIGVQLNVNDDEQQKSTGCYGTKTFYMKIQYDGGTLDGDDIAWLDRLEIVKRFQSNSKDDEASFFRYLL